jgi:hypothetical protein
MSAAATDKFQELGTPGTATTLSAPGYTIGDVAITVASTTNWPSATGVSFAIDRVDSAGVRVEGTYCEFVGVVASSTSITDLDLTYGTAQDYAAGTTTRVYIPVSSTRENLLVQGIQVSLDQDGTLKAGAVDNAAALAADVVTTAKILDANVTTAKINDSAVTTAKINADAVTDAKLIYGKLRSRQGGSATNWGTSGTTTYDYSAVNVYEQCGTASGNSGADVTVTFPTAFNQVPNITATCSTANSANCYTIVVTKSATQFTFRCIDAGGTQRSEEIFWRAIGE